MQVFIKTSNIPERLGFNFSVFGSLTPNSIVVLSKSELLGGSIIEVAENETKIIIQSIESITFPIEVNINTQNKIPFTASSFVNTTFRPTTENGEIESFREEVFPDHIVEQIIYSKIGESIFIDFFNRSEQFTILESEFEIDESQVLTNIKIGYANPQFDVESEESILNFPYFICTSSSENLENPFNLEIHDPQLGVSYEVTKIEGSEGFSIKEYIYTDKILTL